MLQDNHRQGESVPPADDPRWQLVQRIAGGTIFQKSNRLREFLLFAGARTIANPDSPIREHEIGVLVFGRPANYDTSQDTLVRVQASQLRKKLQQHFAEEGGEEPLVVEMPKGSYSLAFRPRCETGAAPAAGPGRPVRAWLSWVAAAVLAVAVVWLLAANLELRHRAQLGMGPKPSVDRLWGQLFLNGQHNYLVMADANLVVFEDAIKQQMSIADYQHKNFERLATDRIADPAIRALTLNVVNRPYTGLADAGILRRMALVFASNDIPMELLLARDLTSSQVSTHNTVLMGSRRANPWVGLYEDRLNFQTVFEETPKAAYLVNRAPKPGEQPAYRGIWSQLGYCRVAFLPSSKASGSVLLISGTDVPSTEAGGEFITSESAIVGLRKAMGLASGDPVPHFEVLLEAHLLNNAVSESRLVAWRRH